MKKILIALALCLVLVGLTASPAFAQTTKVPLNRCIGEIDSDPIYEPSAITPPRAIYGYATFIVNQGDNEVTVNLTVKGADKNTKYYVYLSYHANTPDAEPQTSKLGTLTTNRLGNWGGQNSQGGGFEKALPPGEYDVSVNLQLVDQWEFLPYDGDMTSYATAVRIKISS